MVRQAGDADALRIVRLLRNFHSAGEFDFPFDAARLHAFVRSVITSPSGACFVVGDPIVGVLVASYADSVIGLFKYAEEHLVWIEPGERGQSWTALRHAFEEWAKAAGCTRLKISAQQHIRPAAMARLYGRAGYAPCETVFSKEI